MASQEKARVKVVTGGNWSMLIDVNRCFGDTDNVGGSEEIKMNLQLLVKWNRCHIV